VSAFQTSLEEHRFGIAAIVIGSALFLVSGAPASDTLGKGHGAIEVRVSGSEKWRTMVITGTPRADRLRIDRKPGKGPYVIEANRRVAPTEGPCQQVAPTLVQCRLPDGTFHTVGVFLNAGADRVRMPATEYTGPVIFGGEGADTLIGGKETDILLGGSGGDALRGRGGPDALVGKAGDDTLNGGNAADRLNGNRGHDRCVGGPGKDERTNC
jgi:Ca2+-binding RTX toxin-like protein